MGSLFRETLIGVVKATAPLIGIIILLQVVFVQASGVLFLKFVIGTLLVIAGMVLFLLGIEIGILPAGRLVGSGLIQSRSIWLIAAVAFLIGFSTTIAEPDVLVLSMQAEGISGGEINGNSLVYIIGIGLAVFTVLAMLRILAGIKMAYLLAASYLVVILLAVLTPADFVPLAFDSGSVTTGALTAPIVISLGIGFSSVLAGRSPVSDGFGLIGFASIGPIIAVMIMGIIAG
ncbi:Protein of unknown function (DUF1538) [Dehalogenimonas alkenigignens]|uniref:DUF1538 domain-containing protein n=1 Tax=Dehalogenimonas alkenigignens TaxID=1217799 RepID=A0A0W0GK64_9CHLR|nr:DUF1538 domain-containing protein [Dehalogenimonas alkenigignens]KTB48956.1 Protein of unknown function (DUF1538) [Dehalogenimonas alkenigignens]